MAKNKISDLRNHLFETLEALKDADKPMDIERAHAISEIAQTIINTAKVEVDLVKAAGLTKPCAPRFFEISTESADIKATDRPSMVEGERRRLAS